MAPSARDGAPALVLDYRSADVPDRLFGTLLGMRDELRELSPGLLVGLGSMTLTGGVGNSAPFLLRRVVQEEVAAGDGV